MNTMQTKPHLTAVTLDKLTLVRYIPASDGARVRQILREMRRKGNANKWGKRPFGMGFEIPLLNKPRQHWLFHIQAVNQGPYSDQCRLWMCFNPGILDDPSLQHLIDQLGHIVGIRYPEFISVARVTRVDIALDFTNLQINDMCFYKANYSHWDIHIEGKRIESIRFGSRNTQNKIRIYDKAAQLKKIHGTHAKPSCRVELQFAPNIHLSKIPSLLKKIPELKAYDLRGLSSSRPELKFFSDACQLRTVGGAIQRLDNATKQHIRRQLKRYDTDLLEDRDLIGRMFRQHLKTIDRLKPS